MADKHMDLGGGITRCGICDAPCIDPEVLPCLHCYCRQCIHERALRAGITRPFPCPECAQDTILPTAFFIKLMKERDPELRQPPKVDKEEDGICQSCKAGNKVEGFCDHCKSICAECMKLHQTLTIFATHKMQALKRSGVSMQGPSRCPVHEQWLMDFYCFDCKCLTCRDCIVDDHREHTCKSVKKVAPDTREELKQRVKPLGRLKADLSQALEEVQMTVFEIEDQGQSVADYIESSFEELQQVIENRKQELLKESTSKVRHKLKHLSEQQKGLSTACAAVQRVIDYTEQCVEHSADDKVMLMHTEIQSRIREIEEQQKERKDLEPVEEVDLGVEVNCAEALKQLCQIKAKIIQFAVKRTIAAWGWTWNSRSEQRS